MNGMPWMPPAVHDVAGEYQHIPGCIGRELVQGLRQVPFPEFKMEIRYNLDFHGDTPARLGARSVPLLMAGSPPPAWFGHTGLRSGAIARLRAAPGPIDGPAAVSIPPGRRRLNRFPSRAVSCLGKPLKHM